jgi:AraC-like DNA-binding protein
MLDILVRDFVVGHAEFLDRLLHAEQADAILGLAPSAPAHAVGGPLPSHPQVANALRYIDEHLSDPKLSVGSIARALDIHPYYLGQLFAEQIGERMSRFIVSRRIERAKTLLAKGKRQIKRVAHETGFANPNWFCHVFKVYTGLAPGEYRSAAGEQPAGE